MIKINFSDMPLSFNKENNLFISILNKKFSDIEISENPDFLIYSCYGNDHFKYKDCVKIFWTVEPIVPNFNECDYAVGFDYLKFGDRYMRRPLWLFESMPDEKTMNDEFALNRKFCNFVYSNESNGEGAILRKRFAEKLMNYKAVDCPGKVLNNMVDAISPRDKDWRQGKLDFIRNYKFTIAFENTMYDGYTTEKLVEPFSVKSIPIYWGNPSVDKNFNERAYINCNNMGHNFDKIIDSIIKLDQNNDLYLQMLHEKPMNESFNYEEVKELEDFLYNIIQKGKQIFNKDPLNYQRIMQANTKVKKNRFSFWRS